MNTRHMINIILLQVDYVVQVPNLARAIAAEHLLQVFQDLFLAPTKPLILVVLPTKDASGVSAKLKSPLTGLPHPRSWHGQSREQKVLNFQMLPEKKTEMDGWRCTQYYVAGILSTNWRRERRTWRSVSKRLTGNFFLQFGPQTKHAPFYFMIWCTNYNAFFSGKLLTWSMLTVQEAWIGKKSVYH